MNYQENPYVYLKPPAMRPMDMYQVKSQLANNLDLTGGAIANLGQVTNDHAIRIDELRNEFENMKAFMLWVSETHPEVMREHNALQDIERASK
jgi:hypothetical protein